MKQHKVTIDELQRMKRLRELGFSHVDCAKYMGLSLSTTNYLIDHWGLKNKNYQWSQAEDSILENLYPTTSVKQLSKVELAPRTESAINYRASKKGIKKAKRS